MPTLWKEADFILFEIYLLRQKSQTKQVQQKKKITDKVTITLVLLSKNKKQETLIHMHIILMHK